MTSHNMYVVDIYFIIMYIYIYILKHIYMYTTTTTSGYCIASSSRIHNFIKKRNSLNLIIFIIYSRYISSGTTVELHVYVKSVIVLKIHVEDLEYQYQSCSSEIHGWSFLRCSPITILFPISLQQQ